MTRNFTQGDLAELLREQLGPANADNHWAPEACATNLLGIFDQACSTADPHPGRFVLCVASTLLIAGSLMAVADPTTDNADGTDVAAGDVTAFHIVALWLDTVGYVLRGSNAERRKLLELARRFAYAEALQLSLGPTDGGDQPVLAVGGDQSDLAEIKTWLTEHVVHLATGMTLLDLQEDAQMGNLPHSYVGCSITAITSVDVGQNEQGSAAVAAVLDDAGITTYEPIVNDTPRRGTSWSDRIESRVQDELQVAAASLVVVLFEESAAGLGALIEMAGRYQVPVLVLTDNERVSPMLRGASTVTVRRPGHDVAATLRNYLLELWPVITGHARRLRKHTATWTAQIEDLMSRIDAIPDEYLVNDATVSMTRERFALLLNHPELWGGATQFEIGELEDLIRRLEPPALTRSQYRAFVRAVVELGLDDREADKLERAGRTAITTGAGVTQRAAPDRPAWWMDLWVNNVE